jgi:hypothetical protein
MKHFLKGSKERKEKRKKKKGEKNMTVKENVHRREVEL